MGVDCIGPPDRGRLYHIVKIGAIGHVARADPLIFNSEHAEGAEQFVIYI